MRRFQEIKEEKVLPNWTPQELKKIAKVYNKQKSSIYYLDLELPENRSRSHSETSESTVCTTKVSPMQNRKFYFTCLRALKNPENILSALTLLSMILAVPVGLSISRLKPRELTVELIGLPGELLSNMLNLMVFPLLFSSLVSGISNPAIKSMNRIGVFMLFYFFFSNLAAVLIGIVLMVIIQPGNNNYLKNIVQSSGYVTDKSQISQVFETIKGLILSIFSDGLLQAAFPIDNFTVTYINRTNGTNVKVHYSYNKGINLMACVSFSIFFGLVIKRLSNQTRELFDLMVAINDTCCSMVRIMIWYTPVGVFSLLIKTTLEIEKWSKKPSAKEIFEQLGYVLLTLLTGFLLQTCLQAMSYLVLANRNPIKIFLGSFQACVTAFGTASSAVTLPITLRCMEDNLGIDKRITKIVVPIGTAVNLNAAAMFIAAAGVFAAQLFDIRLTPDRIITASFLAMMASISTPGVLGGVRLTMPVVASAFGVNCPKIWIWVELVDWLIDRCGTVVNLMGDVFCAATLQHICKFEEDGPSVIPNSDMAEELKEIDEDPAGESPRENDI